MPRTRERPQDAIIARRNAPGHSVINDGDILSIYARADSRFSHGSPGAGASFEGGQPTKYSPKATARPAAKPTPTAGSSPRNGKTSEPVSDPPRNATTPYNFTSATSSNVTHRNPTEGSRRPAKAQLGVHNSTDTHFTNATETNSADGGSQTAKGGYRSKSHANLTGTNAAGQESARAGSGNLPLPTSDAIATDAGSDSADSTATAAASEDTSSTNDGQPANAEDAPAYNLNNLTCDDYLGIKSPADKWKAVDGDNAVQDFINMFNSDKLYCPECFGYANGEQCDSKNKLCSEGIRTRATPEGGNASWSVAAALFGKYANADRFTCQVGPNECDHAPDCGDLQDGDGASSYALLTSVSNAYLSFATNYESIREAGHDCDKQMAKFSDVFAPVPDSEGEIIALIVLTSLLGGLTAFLGLAGGAIAGIAVGLASGIGMEKFFTSRPGSQDTSGTLGIIVDDILKNYGEMINALFQNGEFSHRNSDGRAEVTISLQNMTRDGNLANPDLDPKNQEQGLIPTYKRILFQQLALVTWQSLEVDGKDHVPFIAFDLGPCDKVDHNKDDSLNKNGFDGIEKLDVQVDYQGNCYYLLDGIPHSSFSVSGSSLDCIGAKLPGGTNGKMTENADNFADLSLADFVIPSVLGWQAHSKTNGYQAASANGNVIKDPRAPGVANIPVCDYRADFEHPGVGCPLIGEVGNEKKCDLVGSGEGKNPPGQFQQGKCRAHVTQWQKNEVQNNANQLPDYQLSVDIYDQTNRVVGSATKQDAAKPLEVADTSLPFNLIVAPGNLDSDPVSFWYADQFWTSADTGPAHNCKGGSTGNGKEYDNGARKMDCGFDCPLEEPDDNSTKSATIDHPLPAAPVQAVAGPTSYVNTYSKTAGPAPAAATPTYVSGVCPMKITQYQKHEADSNPTNDYMLEINVKDPNGNEAANLPKLSCPSGTPVVMHGLKAGDFTITIGKNLPGPLTDTSPISFNYNGQDFDTDSLRCAGSNFDGQHKQKDGGYEKGDRELNCNINC